MIADPSRAAMLIALSDGRALPAGELARCARISPQTASAHLDKLFRSRFLAVEIQGRHRYYRLRSPQVASILESLRRARNPVKIEKSLEQRGGHGFPADECAVVVSLRIEDVIAEEFSLFSQPVAVAAFDDVDVLVGPRDGDELDELSWRRAELEQEGDSASLISAVAQ